jgi:hypothetical protein
MVSRASDAAPNGFRLELVARAYTALLSDTARLAALGHLGFATEILAGPGDAVAGLRASAP